MTPFFEWCLDKLVPTWMAPNLVTLLGLAMVVITTLTYLPFDLAMAEEFPAWKYFFSAFAVFAYLTLDILDGKQARKTGSSSPLGQMFDHGCDAWSSQLLVFVPTQIMKVGYCVEFLVYYVSLIALFYSA